MQKVCLIYKIDLNSPFFVLQLLLVLNMTALDRTNFFRYTETCPGDCHFYGHGELRQYTYCDKYRSKILISLPYFMIESM